MKGYTPWKIEIDLPFEHYCKGCVEFDPHFNILRDATLREKIGDFFYSHPIREKRVIESRPNWCSKHKKQVDPAAKEPCFIWTGSHEAWMPKITATIVDGKLKVVFK